jgi:phosphatidylserine/phosphatidylglycerophosphate/cardiolipin synthase-like enzyme
VTDYPDRDITTIGSRLVPFDLIQSIFVGELIRPSRRLWISSPWISDIDVIDNTRRQFSSLEPEWPAARIHLSAVFRRLLEQSSRIVVIVNDSPHNHSFIARLERLQLVHGAALRVLTVPTLHEKGLLGDHCTLNGSMNFTFSGVYRNEEYLVYRCDPAKIAERRLLLESRWGTD